jgi:hypothetical protein
VKLKRLVVALAIFSLSGIGITYAAGTDTNAVQNFFLGGTDIGNPNLNQVLALLVGPQGVPGPAGVAGTDGFVGMNGQDGQNGLDGAPGEVGPQGPAGAQGPAGPAGAQGPAGANGLSVVTVELQTGDARCPQGGAKFTDAAGTVTYACNGSAEGGGAVRATSLPTNDPNCVNGGTKFTDAAGTNTYACNGSVTQSDLGLGNIALSACDNNVRVAIRTDFNGVFFSMASVLLSNVDESCNGSKLEVYIPIRTEGVKIGTSNLYRVGTPAEIITCTINPVAVDHGAILVSDETSQCKVKTSGAFIRLDEVNAQDVGTNVGLTLSSND